MIKFKNLLQLNFQKKHKDSSLYKYIIDKRYKINNFFLKKSLLVNKGNQNILIYIKKKLIGTKVGMLVFTKKMGASIHIKKKKKKKKKKKFNNIYFYIGIWCNW